MSDTLPKEIGDLLWQEACRRADAIRKVLKCGNEQTSAAEIVGDQMGSAATNAVDVKSEVHSVSFLTAKFCRRGRNLAIYCCVTRGHRVTKDPRQVEKYLNQQPQAG